MNFGTPPLPKLESIPPLGVNRSKQSARWMIVLLCGRPLQLSVTLSRYATTQFRGKPALIVGIATRPAVPNVASSEPCRYFRAHSGAVQIAGAMIVPLLALRQQYVQRAFSHHDAATPEKRAAGVVQVA